MSGLNAFCDKIEGKGLYKNRLSISFNITGGEKLMREKWLSLLFDTEGNLFDSQTIKCPACKEKGVEYLFTGDAKTRIGYLQVWCSKCLRGIYVSRAKAPDNARFLSFDEEHPNIVPDYEIDD